MKNRHIVFMVIVVIALIVFLYELGRTAHRYISPTGSNDSSGTTSGAAWLTFAYAQTQAASWDTLWISDGVYQEANASPASIYTTLYITISGTSSQKKVFHAVTKYGPDIRGYGDNAYSVGDPPINRAVYIAAGVHDVEINGILARYSASGITLGTDGSGSLIERINIKNCRVCSTGTTSGNMGENNGGIKAIGPPIESLFVDSCVFHHNFENPAGTGVNAGGIWLYSTSYSKFRYNTIYDESGAGDYHGGIMLKINNTGGVAQGNDHNEVSYNTIYDANIGIRLYHYANYNDVHHNTIYNCDRGVEIDGPFAARAECTNDENYIYNNTIYNCSEFGIGTLPIVDEDWIDSVYFFNNIIYSSGTQHCLGILWGASFGSSAPIRKLYSDYNCFYHTDTTYTVGWGQEYSHSNFTLSSHRSTHSLDTHTIKSNPYFVNAAAYNFNLADSSAALTGGRGGSYLSYMGAYAPASSAIERKVMIRK